MPATLQQDVLVFDWWIRNSDRFQTEKGGNPNLFWEPDIGNLVVIDHNQAFDSEFNSNEFLEYHVVSGEQYNIFNNMVLCREYNQRLSSALGDR